MTQRQIELWLTPEGEKNLIQSQCIKRKLYPDDVARLVLFLASDDSSGMHQPELHYRRRAQLTAQIAATF